MRVLERAHDTSQAARDTLGPPMRAPLAVPFLFLLLASGPDRALAQAPGARGEALPASALGPGVVEPMAKVLLRQRALPPQLRVLANAHDGSAGRWLVPARDAATARPHSGQRYAINQWGDVAMAIGFPDRVDVEGAWFAAQGGRGSATTAVRALGYRDGQEVAHSEWLESLSTTPLWLAMDLRDVDRIVVQARPTRGGAGWFAMDDLTYRDTATSTRIVVDFEDIPWRTVLTDSGYRGLRWERGAGKFAPDDERTGQDGVRAVPPPQRPPQTQQQKQQPSQIASSLAGNTAFCSLGGTSPHVTWSTTGPMIFDPGSACIPPDSSGAAGPQHFLSFVNSNLSVYRKDTRARVVNVALTTFFALPGGVGIGDVRAVFDPHSQRFVVAASTGPYRWIYLAVSQSSDPTGAWFKTSFLAALGSDSNKWPDFPTLGVDRDGIYLASLMVGGSYPITIWALDKAPLLQANPSLGTITAWRNNPWEGAIQPCTTHGNAIGEFLISCPDQGTFRLRRIAGPMTAPTLVDLGLIPVPWQDSPPAAPALGSTTDISTGDFRPSHATWRNGSIWVARGVSHAGRAACSWYQIDSATKAVLQSGTVADPVRSYYYPSLVANDRGDVAMACNGSHAGEYVGAYYTGRLANDPPGAMSEPALLCAGEGPYERVDGNGINRWGDYSYCSVDPANDSFWTIQEYARTNNDWGTWIARLEFDWFNYGSGWPGTLGVPDLSIWFGRPLLGTFQLLHVGNSGAATASFLLLGLQPDNLPVLGGTVLVAPMATETVPASRFLVFSIPNWPSLLGISIFMQAIEIDAGASSGLSFSRGLEMRIGM